MAMANDLLNDMMVYSKLSNSVGFSDSDGEIVDEDEEQEPVVQRKKRMIQRDENTDEEDEVEETEAPAKKVQKVIMFFSFHFIF